MRDDDEGAKPSAVLRFRISWDEAIRELLRLMVSEVRSKARECRSGKIGMTVVASGISRGAGCGAVVPAVAQPAYWRAVMRQERGV